MPLIQTRFFEVVLFWLWLFLPDRDVVYGSALQWGILCCVYGSNTRTVRLLVMETDFRRAGE